MRSISATFSRHFSGKVVFLRVVLCHVKQFQLAGRQMPQQLVVANPNRADRRTEMTGVMKNQSGRAPPNASRIAALEHVA